MSANLGFGAISEFDLGLGTSSATPAVVGDMGTTLRSDLYVNPTIGELQRQVAEQAKLLEELKARASMVDIPIPKKPKSELWSKLSKDSEIQKWVANFERRCNVLKMVDQERCEMAMILLGERILESVATRLPELNEPEKSEQVTWARLKSALLDGCTGEHPLCHAYYRWSTMAQRLKQKKAPLDEIWSEMCSTMEEFLRAGEQQFGTWNRDTVRRALMPPELLRHVSVQLPAAANPFSKSPEDLFAECRRVWSAAGMRVTASDDVCDALARDNKRNHGVTESSETSLVTMTKKRKLTCFRCGKEGHMAKECTAPKPVQSKCNDLVSSPLLQEPRQSPKRVLRPRLVQAILSVENKDCLVLFDSCSTCSFIDSNFCKRMNFSSRIESCQRPIRGITMDFRNATGTLKFEITATNSKGFTRSFHVSAYVLKLPVGDVLLGNDIMSSYQFTLDYKNLLVHLGGKVNIPMEVEYEEVAPEQDETVLILLENLELPPFSQTLARVEASAIGALNYCGYVEPSEVASVAGILCARGYPEFYGSRAKVLLLNATVKPVQLPAGSEVGRVVLINRDDVFFTCEAENQSSEDETNAGQGMIPSDLDLTTARKLLSRTNFNALIKLLRSCSALWRRPDQELGADVSFSHRIETTTPHPVHQKPRRLPAAKMAEARAEVDRMLRLNVIEPSHAGWSAPIVLVTKKDGGLRFCVDYRKLNEATIVDVYPLPRCDDLLGSLHGKKFFSALDLEAGYWQIRMQPEDREKTTFVTPFGAWQFKVMPFGLCNAPSTFQRTMDIVLSGAKWNHCLVYIDDILIFSETPEQHLKDLADVFQRLIKFNFKLKPTKCDLFRTHLLFLGHNVSAEGIKPNPAKTKAIMDWPAPRCLKDVESFLGVCGYYRKFIKNFALEAAPLYALKKKGVEFTWGEVEQQAFMKLKHKLANPPVLCHPRFNDPFIIEVDACREGLGAVLVQEQDDKTERAIEYASRLLRKHEQNYAVRELEALGVLWACEIFRHFVLYQKFIVRSDHKSLEVLKNVQGGRLERWVMRLAPFTFELHYKKKALHTAPDGLSRSGQDTHPEQVASDELPEEMTLIADVAAESLSDIFAAQQADPRCAIMSEYLRSGICAKTSHMKQGKLAARAKDFALINRVLFRNGLLVIPESLKCQLLKALHEEAHFSADKLLPQIRKRFWWPHMTQDVRAYCRACVRCNRATPYASERQGLLCPIQASGPWSVVAMDLAGPFVVREYSREDHERYVLVIMDHFTKYVILIALSTKHAALITREVKRYLLYVFGCPQTIITDNGTEFKAEFAEMCKAYGIVHSCVLPYHHQANGLVERYMQSLNKMVRIMASEDRSFEWSEVLQRHAFAYNTNFHMAISNTPYFLNFGRDPNTGIDNQLRCGVEMRLWEFGQERGLAAEQLWQKTAQRIQEYQRGLEERYNKRHRQLCLRQGDIVFVRREGVLKKSEMRWSEPCRVIRTSCRGLRVVVRSLTNGDESEVALQRIRPYYPSKLNPEIWAQELPPRSVDSPPETQLTTTCESGDSEYPSEFVPITRWPSDQGPSYMRTEPSSRRESVENDRTSGNPPLANGPEADCHGSNAIETQDLSSQAQDVSQQNELTTQLVSVDSSGLQIAPASPPPVSNLSTSGENPSVVDESPLLVDEQIHQDSGISREGSSLADGEFYVDSLVDSRVRRNQQQYLVRWWGYGPEDDSWEPESELPRDMVEEFNRTHNSQQRAPQARYNLRTRR